MADTFEIEKPETNFSIVSNTPTYDSNISFKAKGIYTYLVSKPAGFQFSTLRMQSEAQDGKKSIRAGMKELLEAGYIERMKKGDGRTYYKVHINPKSQNGTQGLENGGTIPESQKGTEPKGHRAKRGLINNTELNTNTDIKNKTEIYISTFNEKFGTKYRVTAKLDLAFKNRLKVYSFDELRECIDKAYISPFYRGENDRGWTVSPEWILRNDENPQKLLNLKETQAITPKPQQPKTFLQLELEQKQSIQNARLEWAREQDRLAELGGGNR